MATSFVVDPFDVGLRLDALLARRFPEQSRAYFQSLIDDKKVRLNGSLVKKRNRIQAGDAVDVEWSQKTEVGFGPESIPLDILFEDEAIIVLNKPSGLVVHPAPGHGSGTIANGLLHHCQNSHLFDSQNLRPGIVHRLDKDTSGLLIAAKTPQSHQLLVKSFAARQVHKEYLALCHGHPGYEGTVHTMIARHRVHRQRMAVCETGKEAITVYRTLAKNQEISLLGLQIKTGRTHQIRVHLSHLKTPVIGDTTYSSSQINAKYNTPGMMLHASCLGLKHPITGIWMEWQAPLPEEMTQFCQTHLGLKSINLKNF